VVRGQIQLQYADIGEGYGAPKSFGTTNGCGLFGQVDFRHVMRLGAPTLEDSVQWCEAISDSYGYIASPYLPLAC
jgi:hypothetical protein